MANLKADIGNLSIHPRSWTEKQREYFGLRHRTGKVNTCLPPHPDRRGRLIAALEEHLSRHPNDGETKARLVKLLRAA